MDAQCIDLTLCRSYGASKHWWVRCYKDVAPTGLVPWSDFSNERLNPQNGLCLSRLHAGAFDAGLIAFDRERKLMISKRLKKFLPQTTVQQNFEAFAGTAFALPEDTPEPNAEFLRYHREKVFS
jgi:putative restriction endonuclease